jgi:HSP20 family molecular chaperone IbpA
MIMATQEMAKREQADVVRRNTETTRYFEPAADIYETEEQVVLEFDMPGVSSDNVELMVEKGTLTVTGKAGPEESGTAVYRETHVGDYRRTFSLSEDVDADDIHADMKAGVLTVRIPKPEKAKPKRIAIASA